MSDLSLMILPVGQETHLGNMWRDGGGREGGGEWSDILDVITTFVKDGGSIVVATIFKAAV